MKPVSIRLPDAVLEALDEKATARGYESRSAYIRQVLRTHVDSGTATHADQTARLDRLEALVRLHIATAHPSTTTRTQAAGHLGRSGRPTPSRILSDGIPPTAGSAPLRADATEPPTTDTSASDGDPAAGTATATGNEATSIDDEPADDSAETVPDAEAADAPARATDAEADAADDTSKADAEPVADPSADETEEADTTEGADPTAEADETDSDDGPASLDSFT